MKTPFIVLLLTVGLLCIPTCGYAQKNNHVQHIEGLSIFPNPVTNHNTTIRIASTSTRPKHINIYNVLGARIINTIVYNTALDISSLTSGVYILEITQNTISESRKLVIR